MPSILGVCCFAILLYKVYKGKGKGKQLPCLGEGCTVWRAAPKSGRHRETARGRSESYLAGELWSLSLARMSAGWPRRERGYVSMVTRGIYTYLHLRLREVVRTLAISVPVRLNQFSRSQPQQAARVSL